jgi:hypothetical protein
MNHQSLPSYRRPGVSERPNLTVVRTFRTLDPVRNRTNRTLSDIRTLSPSLHISREQTAGTREPIHNHYARSQS